MIKTSIIIMGVSGCGKTTVGAALARRLGIPFFDADAYHPKTNQAKLQQDIPLTDEDRLPWLQELSQIVAKANQKDGCVLACSALKKEYRKILVPKSGMVKFYCLTVSPQTAKNRIGARSKIADSLVTKTDRVIRDQFQIIELTPDLIMLDGEETPQQIVNRIAQTV